ncbi:MAG: murein biosynthesis integral membrane protein MurJ, partial [Methylococcaceae bacterium]
MNRQLFKETAIVSSLTLLSRILGFVRDMLIARLFGVSPATDAFFVAFKLPNFFRRLFAEGALAHVFVPVLASYQQQGNANALKAFIAKITGNLALSLLVLSLVGISIAPLLVWLLAPGFAWHGTQHELAVLMLRICMPYLAFISLVALAGCMLNAYGKFALTALTPALLNIVMIAAAVWLAPLMAEPVTALAWGVFGAGLLQVAMQIPALIRLGLLPKPRLDFHDAAVKQLTKKVLPAVFSVSVTQINLLLDTLIASFLAVGSVSWLYYSDRLVEFPVGLLGLALGTVILPKLAKAHVLNKPQDFSNALDWGLRLVVLISIPATIG